MASNLFQELLHERLKERGDLARVARESGLQATVIARWKNGSVQPSPRNLWLIAGPLGVPFETLMRMCGYLPDLPIAPTRPAMDRRLQEVIRCWPGLHEAVKDWLAECLTRPRRPKRPQLA